MDIQDLKTKAIETLEAVGTQVMLTYDRLVPYLASTVEALTSKKAQRIYLGVLVTAVTLVVALVIAAKTAYGVTKDFYRLAESSIILLAEETEPTVLTELAEGEDGVTIKDIWEYITGVYYLLAVEPFTTVTDREVEDAYRMLSDLQGKVSFEPEESTWFFDPEDQPKDL